MLPRKKSKNEASKPAEVQGKYVKKETSPLLRSESLGLRFKLALFLMRYLLFVCLTKWIVLVRFDAL